MQKNIEENNKKTVVVGMSGGVDSSVVAVLLKKQGYNVIGLHMKSENSETAIADQKRVEDICKKFDIKLEIVEYSNEMQIVKDYFLKTYLEGKTPNPCVVCNREVKFKPFIEFAEKLSADYFATGHYAIIEHIDGKSYIRAAKDRQKDQSYFLCQLSQAQLQKAMFPLGEFTKAEVRKIAEENGLAFDSVKESQDICFLGSQKFKDYMAKTILEKPGDIVDVSTEKVVGRHTGISKYTIGQRKGLGIGGGYGSTGESWSVVKKDIGNNVLYVCQGNLKSADGLIAKEFNWIPEKPSEKFECFAKFRYRQELKKVTVLAKDDSDKVVVEFNESQSSIAPGQFVVLYEDDNLSYCLGGGVIEDTITKPIC